MFILSLLIDKASAVYKYEISSFLVTDRCVFCIFTPYLLSSVMNQSWKPSLYPKTVSPAICLVDTGFGCVYWKDCSLWQEQLSEHTHTQKKKHLHLSYCVLISLKAKQVCNLSSAGFAVEMWGLETPSLTKLFWLELRPGNEEGLRFNRIVPLWFPFIL